VVDAPAELPAQLDADRLAQIIANLVENALKYAATRVVVATGAGAAAIDPLWITVSDDGPGIPASEVDRLFERNHTVRAQPGRAVSTGLGLAIVRELARAMGGDATVLPGPGGARFEVRLTRRPTAPTAPATST
jgi:signal transduction histidine kinase